MDRKEISSIGDVLRQVIAENDMQDRLDELKAASGWRAVVGDYVADLTCTPYVRNGAMTVRVPDAGLRHELSMHRSAIINDLNRIAGRQVIKSIRFVS